MENKEMLVAMESVICEFIKSQFCANGVSPMEGYILMKDILSEFQGECLRAFVMGRIEVAPAMSQKVSGADGTGTADGKEDTDGNHKNI